MRESKGEGRKVRVRMVMDSEWNEWGLRERMRVEDGKGREE